MTKHHVGYRPLDEKTGIPDRDNAARQINTDLRRWAKLSIRWKPDGSGRRTKKHSLSVERGLVLWQLTRTIASVVLEEKRRQLAAGKIPSLDSPVHVNLEDYFDIRREA